MLKTQVYQKENSIRFTRLLKDSLVDMFHSRFLAKQLTVRDIKGQYRQSYFGIIWIFVTPLATASVWIFLNSSGTLQVTDTGVPYPVFAFSGTLLWSIIVEAINSPIRTTNSARSILSKINFPKEALIVSGIYKLLFNSSVKLFLLFVFLFFYGVGFHSSLLLFPVAIACAILFGTTIGLFLTPIGMLYNDISRMIAFGLQFLMYATPVVYAIPKDGLMRDVMLYNPFTPIIQTSKDFLLGMTPEYLTYFGGIMAVVIPLFFVALVFYRISIPVIVERLSA